MAINKGQLGIGLGFLLVIIILIICIVAPWRWCDKRKQKIQKVQFDPTIQYHSAPASDELPPPTLPAAPALEPPAAPLPSSTNEDAQFFNDVERNNTEQHRLSLLRGVHSAHRGGVSPTTSAMLMTGASTVGKKKSVGLGDSSVFRNLPDVVQEEE